MSIDLVYCNQNFNLKSRYIIVATMLRFVQQMCPD